jgi:hypothetical protein
MVQKYAGRLYSTLAGLETARSSEGFSLRLACVFLVDSLWAVG